MVDEWNDIYCGGLFYYDIVIIELKYGNTITYLIKDNEKWV